MNILRRVLQIALPLLVVFGGLKFKDHLASKREPPPTFTPPPFSQVVETLPITATNYPVRIQSQGSVQAEIRSTLVPEVSGKVTRLSPRLLEGGWFSAGEVLLEIEQADYVTAITLAEAEQAQRLVQVQQEEARAAQARIDWKKIGRDEEPSDLVLREPQLAEARAALKAAEARLEQARRDLERTVIRAPYNGRVLEKRVALSQYVTPGTLLATIYGTDVMEIPLPVSEAERRLIPLEEGAGAATGPAVTLRSSLHPEQQWAGRIVRSQGTVDRVSRQHVLIARVDAQPGAPPLLVGQFVQAEIQGTVLEQVVVLPRSALRENRQVLLVDPDRRLRRKEVTVLWGDVSQVVVAHRFEADALLCVTPLSYAAEGSAVRLTTDPPPGPQEGRGGPGPGNGKRPAKEKARSGGGPAKSH